MLNQHSDEYCCRLNELKQEISDVEIKKKPEEGNMFKKIMNPRISKKMCSRQCDFKYCRVFILCVAFILVGSFLAKVRLARLISLNSAASLH
ncbi:hypothetical protein T4D_3916 [Trichinella pseudospiralis]|uniref:Uncharacterized protein n=1 Tax=Trichinella pseudospiralis TaxID=6337 RepID=A0A0V1FYD5_TRIPS|nr:hypothetical protein T4D_3916 [Trichinella pseudospiralis]